jgi:type IV secretion system protein VirD4
LPATLYIVIRPSDLNRLMPIARIIINQIIQLNTESMSATEKQYRHEMLVLLDEFPALGRVPVFERALGYIAGYGLRTLIIAQDRSQIVAHYGKNETIIPNCHIRVCFAPNELETAKWISDMTGVATILKENANVSGKRGAAMLESVSTSIQEVRRPLMTPDEVMKLPGAKKDADGRVTGAGELLVFVAGRSPIRARQVLYWEM